MVRVCPPANVGHPPSKGRRMTSRRHLVPRLPIAIYFGAVVLAACLLPVSLLHLLGQAPNALAVALLAGGATAAAAGYVLHRSVARPLRAVAATLAAASEGELDAHRVESAVRNRSRE